MVTSFTSPESTAAMNSEKGRNLLVLHLLRLERVEEEDHRKRNDHPEGEVPVELVQVGLSPVLVFSMGFSIDAPGTKEIPLSI
jgi:hypothetical protein